ncbi:hypothetical protein F2Q70_00003894 [Brassica cretica]|uniref:Uncharacterized protein n=1 Tax=Brassica cretica TaxID=69181 RepID=A0A8S9IP17_BRACR|nr:hypothetical protein F2Q70_00003894 [Brassica cretica]
MGSDTSNKSGRSSQSQHSHHSRQDISTRPEGDFQRVVVDALSAIWARVSRCRCSSRASVRASSPSAIAPSRQRRDDSEETTDETTVED